MCIDIELNVYTYIYIHRICILGCLHQHARTHTHIYIYTYNSTYVSLWICSWASAPLAQFNLSMTGGRSGDAIASFWQHCFEHEEWLNHPAKFLNGVVQERSSYAFKFTQTCSNHFQASCLQFIFSGLASGLIPVALHTDGAEFYSNSEFYVWSWGSVLATGEAWGCVTYSACSAAQDRLWLCVCVGVCTYAHLVSRYGTWSFQSR